MSTVLPNTPFPQSKRADVRLLGGLPEAGIRARIMSISRALGAEKPATKRPISYMEGFCDRKLSHEHCFAQHPLSKIQRPPRRGGRARAHPPHPPLLPGGCPLRVRDSFYISIYLSIYIYYLSISTYLSLYKIYIYICRYFSLSLSLSLSF